MAFIPVSVTLSVRVTVKNNQVEFPNKVEALALYVSCKDPPASIEKPAVGRTTPSPPTSVQPQPEEHQLNLKEVVNMDGSKLPELAWGITDGGTFRKGCAERPELRIAKITFNGAVLRNLDNEPERALYRAFLAQQTVRLNVRIGDAIEAPLLLKLHLVYGT